MSENTSEPDESDKENDDEMVGLIGLQDNDPDTIKHSQDGYLEERDG